MCNKEYSFLAWSGPGSLPWVSTHCITCVYLGTCLTMAHIGMPSPGHGLGGLPHGFCNIVTSSFAISVVFLYHLGDMGKLLSSVCTLFILRKTKPWLFLCPSMLLFDLNGAISEVIVRPSSEAIFSCALLLNWENLLWSYHFLQLSNMLFSEKFINFLFCFSPPYIPLYEKLQLLGFSLPL